MDVPFGQLYRQAFLERLGRTGSGTSVHQRPLADGRPPLKFSATFECIHPMCRAFGVLAPLEYSTPENTEASCPREAGVRFQ